jgi:hypothetical protein
LSPAVALRSIGSDAKEALVVLNDVLNSQFEDDTVRKYAAEAIEAIGEDHPQP